MVRVVPSGGEEVAELEMGDGRPLQFAIGRGTAPATLAGRIVIVSAEDACGLGVALTAIGEAAQVARADAAAAEVENG